MKLLRVLRGMVGTAVTWGLAWVPMTIGFYTVLNLLGPGFEFPLWPGVVLGGAVRGAISGAAFAGVLSMVARRRSFSQLTFAQLMACGAAGAIIAPGVTLAIATTISQFTIPPAAIAFSLLMSAGMGAVSAAGTLYAARRAPTLAAAEEEEIAIDVTTAPRAIR